MTPQNSKRETNNSNKWSETKASSIRQKNLGVNPNRHPEIREAAESLLKEPANPLAMTCMVDAVVSAVESSAEPRARGKQVRLLQRGAALLSTYGGNLDAQLKAEVRDRLKGPLDALTVAQREDSHYVRAYVAAVMLGVSLADLLVMCRDQATRNALGWPRPLGGHVLFLRDVLDAATSKAALEALPDDEPWPRSSWPAGWR